MVGHAQMGFRGKVASDPTLSHVWPSSIDARKIASWAASVAARHALPALDPGSEPGIQAAPSVIIRGRRPHWLKRLHTSNMRGDEPMRQCVEMGEVRFQDRGEGPSTDLRAARLAVFAFSGCRGGCRR